MSGKACCTVVMAILAISVFCRLEGQKDPDRSALFFDGDVELVERPRSAPLKPIPHTSCADRFDLLELHDEEAPTPENEMRYRSFEGAKKLIGAGVVAVDMLQQNGGSLQVPYAKCFVRNVLNWASNFSGSYCGCITKTGDDLSEVWNEVFFERSEVGGPDSFPAKRRELKQFYEKLNERK